MKRKKKSAMMQIHFSQQRGNGQDFFLIYSDRKTFRCNCVVCLNKYLDPRGYTTLLGKEYTEWANPREENNFVLPTMYRKKMENTDYDTHEDRLHNSAKADNRFVASNSSTQVCFMC